MTRVGATEVSQREPSSGRLRVRLITTRMGRWPPSRLVVSCGPSLRTVLPPTMMASLMARIANTRWREAPQETQAECPVLQAILPSRVMAYLRTLKGRPVATRCRMASFASRHARCASAALTPPELAPAALPSTSTWMPAWRMASMAWPPRPGMGCRSPTTAWLTPACTSASTARPSLAMMPWRGSRFRKAVAPFACSRASSTAISSAGKPPCPI
mmetsp:Transcript_72/g.163  ORF Transcript_72/g.163 Transcript_72/m.163 type:complete len:215 (+) Transcript_72:449-1093(+)